MMDYWRNLAFEKHSEPYRNQAKQSWNIEKSHRLYGNPAFIQVTASFNRIKKGKSVPGSVIVVHTMLQGHSHDFLDPVKRT
ncbi:uncharacterized protein METZ01_LOCUS203337, partial [marine metagenome]